MALSEHRESRERLEEAGLPSVEERTDRWELDAALRDLDVANGRERRLEQQVAKLERRLEAADAALGEGERERERLHDLFEELQDTRSWRWTAPFRFVRGLLPF
jgi:hypothetical protein